MKKSANAVALAEGDGVAKNNQQPSSTAAPQSKQDHHLSPAVGIHPAADAFPLMSPSELQELADDIKANGLACAIMRDKDGTILDGRNRLAACEIAEVNRDSKSTLVIIRSASSSLPTCGVGI